MNLRGDTWKKLFLFSLGLFAGTAFCMKWMEGVLWANGEKFSILGLELFYAREKLEILLSSLDSKVRTILSYHLYFDFAFMAGVYPGISSLCILAGQKVKSNLVIKILIVIAWLQIVAWSSDITENLYLLHWLKEPDIEDNHFAFYHFVVMLKWSLALAGAALSVAIILAGWLRQLKNNF